MYSCSWDADGTCIMRDSVRGGEAQLRRVFPSDRVAYSHRKNIAVSHCFFLSLGIV